MTFERRIKDSLNIGESVPADAELLHDLMVGEADVLTMKSELFCSGLEMGAVIAEHAGIKDVNIQCASGSRIAQKIRAKRKLIHGDTDISFERLTRLMKDRDEKAQSQSDSLEAAMAYSEAKVVFDKTASQFVEFLLT